MIEVQGPDGTVAEFPDGTPPATIKAAMAKHYGAPKARPPVTGYSKAKKRQADAYELKGLPEPIRKVAQTAMDRGLMAAQGASLGWADEGLGALTGAAQFGVNLFNDTGITVQDAYRAQRDVVAERLAARKKAAPVDSAALEIGGGVVSVGGGAAGKFVAGAKTLPGVVARSSAVGAGFGAAAGAGAAKPGASNRLAGATQGAIMGGVIGGAVPVAARGAQVAGRALNATTGYRISGGAAGSAAGRLRDALARDGVDGQKINQLVQQYAETGAMPPTLVDVAGENTRALIRFAGSRPGEARNAAQTYREVTAEAIPDASINRARQLTPGNNKTASETADNLFAARSREAEANYAGPYAARVNVDEGVQRALSDAPGEAALRRARAAAVARMDEQRIAEIDSLLGVKSSSQDVSAATLDRVRIAMRERADKAAQSGARDMSGGLGRRVKMIDDALSQVPEIGPARAAYKAKSEAIDAVDVGQRILKDSPDVFAAAFNGQNPQAVEAARVGARQALTDALGQRSNAAPILRQIAFAPNAKHNLTVLFGEQEADRFIQAARLNLQKGQRADFIAPNTNSQTASRQQDANLFKSALDAVRRPLQAIMERVAAGLTITDAEAAELVRIGLMNPKQALAVTRPRVSAAVANRGLGRASAAGANVLAQQ